MAETASISSQTDATAAEYAFCRVADDARARYIKLIVILLATDSAFAHIQIFRKFLQLAITIAFAIEAVVGVVREQQLQQWFFVIQPRVPSGC
jgi:hypothetical protein